MYFHFSNAYPTTDLDTMSNTSEDFPTFELVSSPIYYI